MSLAAWAFAAGACAGAALAQGAPALAPPTAARGATDTTPNVGALVAADAALAHARKADLEGDTTAVLGAARTALDGYLELCTGRSDCDWRNTWEARLLLARHDLRRGLNSAAFENAQAAAELARTAADTARQALALAVSADLSGLQGDSGEEQRLLAQALRMARLDGDAELRGRVNLYETKILRRRGDQGGARRSAEAGLALARQSGEQRMVALHLVNLSDALVADGQPHAALQAAEQGLPLARKLGDGRTERALTHNAALARIGLGQMPQAQQVLEDLLAAYRASGASADEVVALREFAEAFADSGNLPAALALFHRERELAARIMAANRDAALAELRQRHDREAQQRRLEQLAGESRLMSAQLENRAAMQLVWAAGAAALLLAVTLLGLMVRRVRDLNRRLEHSQAFLRAQSHRDPLTGLGNRRGLHEAAAARGLDLRFEGALLLVDIDHFKHVNDGHGHAAGDVVLVEVARRLADVVRAGDVLVRWGGEEFLVCLPGVDSGHALALAQRVLKAVGGEPVTLPGPAPLALRVTASVGYGCFPLPPARLPLTLERAINLADMALYTAKNQGRNCAVGIRHALAADAAGLHALEHEFDQARRDGRVVLEHLAGPPASVAAPGAADLLQPAGSPAAAPCA
ncbi:MAG: GGDEF domain-containing protein [Rubrivivax sp.]|nr:GGDEF domain-containing protein [Rubrivivax sp.]